MNTATMTLLRRWLARHARNAGTAATLAALSAGALAGPIAFNRHADAEPAPRVERPASELPPTVSSPTHLAQGRHAGDSSGLLHQPDAGPARARLRPPVAATAPVAPRCPGDRSEVDAAHHLRHRDRLR
jgi:hypothetical protein